MYEKDKREVLHLGYFIAYTFFMSVASYLISLLFMPDTSIDPPVISPYFMLCLRIQTALIIVACTAYAIQLAEEKRTLPAIGFTLMSIGQGVLYVVTTFTYNTNAKIEEAFSMATAGMYLMVPAAVVIGLYSRQFPRWVNALTIVTYVPYTLENILFWITGKLSTGILIIDFFGNVFMNIVNIAWGIVILRNAKAEIKKI